jgi:hypothetical protein
MRVLTSHLVSSASVDVGKVPQVIVAGTLSGSFVTSPLDVLHLYGWSASVVTKDVLGTLSIQVSNDPAPPIGLGNSPQLDHWIDYPNVTVQMSGSSDMSVWNLQQMFVRWVRFAWTHQAGTGSIDVNVTGKGSSQ